MFEGTGRRRAGARAALAGDGSVKTHIRAEPRVLCVLPIAEQAEASGDPYAIMMNMVGPRHARAAAGDPPLAGGAGSFHVHH